LGDIHNYQIKTARQVWEPLWETKNEPIQTGRFANAGMGTGSKYASSFASVSFGFKQWNEFRNTSIIQEFGLCVK